MSWASEHSRDADLTMETTRPSSRALGVGTGMIDGSQCAGERSIILELPAQCIEVCGFLTLSMLGRHRNLAVRSERHAQHALRKAGR
jgi:hypothetical protein